MTPPPSNKARLPRLATLLSLLTLITIAFVTLRGKRVEVVKVERGEIRQAVVTSGRVRTPERVEMAS